MSAVAEPSAGPLLSVRDLHVTYGTRAGAIPAVRGVDFDLGVGETLGLAGESGCGKSSLAGALLRLLPRGTQVTGSVLLDGEDVLTMKPGRLRAVRWTELAIVFQGALHTLNPVQRIGRQIGEAIRLHAPSTRGADVSARVGELLELVGLPARRAQDYPHQLSGGQRQRVLIGLALACEPRLLIADEPTTALDVMVQAQVLRLLEDLQQRLGLAVVFITHDLSTLAAVCKRIAVMYAGRIVEDGPSHEVFAAAAASVHARAGRGLPDHRRPGLPDGPVRPGGRPARSARAALRLPVPPALSRGGRRVRVGRRRSCGRSARAGTPRACTSPARGWRRPRPHRRRARSRQEGGPRGPDASWTFATCTSSSAVAPASRERSTASTSAMRAGRDRRPGRRVGLRQDDAGADDRRAAAPGVGQRGAAWRAAALRPPGAARAPPRGADGLPGSDRRAQRAPDDLRGGGRGRAHPGRARRRGAARGRGALARRPAPARALLRPLPLRDLRRPAPAGDHRRGDGARARACSSPTSRSRASTRRCAARSSR